MALQSRWAGGRLGFLPPVMSADPPITVSTHGDVLTAISDGMVALLVVGR